MPKLKTNKSLYKRLKVSGSGKLLRMKIGRSHLRRKRPKRVKRTYHDTMALHPSDAARIKKVFPI